MKDLRASELAFSELQDVKRNLEVVNKEQRQKIETLTYELELTRGELKDLREANKGLDSTKVTFLFVIIFV